MVMLRRAIRKARRAARVRDLGRGSLCGFGVFERRREKDEGRFV